MSNSNSWAFQYLSDNGAQIFPCDVQINGDLISVLIHLQKINLKDLSIDGRVMDKVVELHGNGSFNDVAGSVALTGEQFSEKMMTGSGEFIDDSGNTSSFQWTLEGM